MLTAILERAKAAKGDAGVLLGDLFAFLGYFGLCLYAGGVAYRQTFNDFFRLEVLPERDVFGTGVDFAAKVLSSAPALMAAFAALVVIAVLFFLSRFVLRLWLGYIALVSSLALFLLVVVIIGQTAGEADARSAMLDSDVTLPTIKIDGEAFESVSHGGHRLLSEDGEYIYLIEPVGIAGSVVEISAMRKSEIGDYTVTVR